MGIVSRGPNAGPERRRAVVKISGVELLAVRNPRRG